MTMPNSGSVPRREGGRSVGDAPASRRARRPGPTPPGTRSWLGGAPTEQGAPLPQQAGDHPARAPTPCRCHGPPVARPTSGPLRPPEPDYVGHRRVGVPSQPRGSGSRRCPAMSATVARARRGRRGPGRPRRDRRPGAPECCRGRPGPRPRPRPPRPWRRRLGRWAGWRRVGATAAPPRRRGSARCARARRGRRRRPPPAPGPVPGTEEVVRRSPASRTARTPRETGQGAAPLDHGPVAGEDSRCTPVSFPLVITAAELRGCRVPSLRVNLMITPTVVAMSGASTSASRPSTPRGDIRRLTDRRHPGRIR